MFLFAKLISTFWIGVRPFWKSQLLAFLCSTEGEASGLLPKPIQGINMFFHFAVIIFYPNHYQKEQSGNKTERNDLILSNQILDAAKVNSNNKSFIPQYQSRSELKYLLLLYQCNHTYHVPGLDREEEHVDGRGGNPSTTREDGKVSSSLGRAAEPHSLSPQWDFQVKTVFKRSSIWHCYHPLIHLVWRILQSEIYI